VDGGRVTEAEAEQVILGLKATLGQVRSLGGGRYKLGDAVMNKPAVDKLRVALRTFEKALSTARKGRGRSADRVRSRSSRRGRRSR